AGVAGVGGEEGGGGGVWEGREVGVGGGGGVVRGPVGGGREARWVEMRAGVLSAVPVSVAQNELHFSHQYIARQSQQCPHAWILQRRQRHPASLQNWRQPPCDSRAEPALRVKKQPSPRVPTLPVRVLTYQRNHRFF